VREVFHHANVPRMAMILHAGIVLGKTCDDLTCIVTGRIVKDMSFRIRIILSNYAAYGPIQKSRSSIGRNYCGYPGIHYW
jgi:hypothetical protein